MPEIAEVARVVHFLRRNLVGRAISAVKTQEDDLLYGKVGCSASAFTKALTNKTVLDAQQQGKYFWLVLSSPPHPLLHFGMTGWMEFSNESTFYYQPKDPNSEGATWPPRFTKFEIHTADGGPMAAFVDARRLGRARLIDVPGEEMRSVPPLSLNGPDPVRDRELLTQEWFWNKLSERRVPIKAWLLDQANLSGIGNWVADEVLYAARIHPAALCSTLSEGQVGELREKMLEVTRVAVEALAETKKFPQEWIMKHRWGKGKNGNKLPSGESLSFVTVGGRTSAVVTGRQKMGSRGREKKSEEATEGEKVVVKRKKETAVAAEPKVPKAKKKEKVKQEEQRVTARRSSARLSKGAVESAVLEEEEEGVVETKVTKKVKGASKKRKSTAEESKIKTNGVEEEEGDTPPTKKAKRKKAVSRK